MTLGMHSRQQLENNRDEDGNNVFEAVHHEQVRVREEKKHITVQFWNGLIDRHRLTGGVCDHLAPPSRENKINRQLDAALKAAHHSNPAMKTATPLKRMMSYMGPINKSEFYGLCKGTFQSPSISSPMSKILTESLLKYIGRLRMDEVFNECWQALKGHFDQQLCVLWGNAQSTRVSRPGFLRAHRQELQIFIDMELSCKVEKMIEDGHELIPAGIKQLVKAASSDAELYAPEI